MPIIHVPCSRISQYKSFHAPFGGLFRHVLYEAEPPLETNHCFINTDFFGEGVALLKLGNEWLQKWTQLAKGIMSFFPLLLVETAVV